MTAVLLLSACQTTQLQPKSSSSDPTNTLNTAVVADIVVADVADVADDADADDDDLMVEYCRHRKSSSCFSGL